METVNWPIYSKADFYSTYIYHSIILKIIWSLWWIIYVKYGYIPSKKVRWQIETVHFKFWSSTFGLNSNLESFVAANHVLSGLWREVCNRVQPQTRPDNTDINHFLTKTKCQIFVRANRHFNLNYIDVGDKWMLVTISECILNLYLTMRKIVKFGLHPIPSQFQALFHSLTYRYL